MARRIPTADTLARPAVRRDAQGRIDEDIACVGCGYNLRGLIPDGRCPECATAVGRSLHGDLLRFSNPAWVERVADGLRWAWAATIVLLLSPEVAISAAMLTRDGAWIEAALLVDLTATAWIGAAGWWLVATPEPRTAHEGGSETVRIWMRGLAALAAALLTVTTLNELVDWASTGFLLIAAALLVCAAGVCGLVHLRRLVLRLRSPTLARRCMILAWSLGINVAALCITACVDVALSANSGGGWVPIGFRSMGCATAVEFVLQLFLGIGFMMLIGDQIRPRFRDAARTARLTWAAGDV